MSLQIPCVTKKPTQKLAHASSPITSPPHLLPKIAPAQLSPVYGAATQIVKTSLEAVANPATGTISDDPRLMRPVAFRHTLKRYVMAGETPTGDGSVFHFLDIFALGCGLEACSALFYR